LTEIVEHLLTTKLYRPAPGRSLIRRTELFTRLQSSLHVPLTLLCAPAGFGKTTLLTSWLEQFPKKEDLSVVWLSLDEDDNDPGRFWRYLRAAFERASSTHVSLERDPTLTLLDQITALLHALTSQSTIFLLILDDYHFLHAQPVLNAISHFLQYQPSNVHLFISSRSEPDLPLSRFRVRNQLEKAAFNLARVVRLGQRIGDVRLLPVSLLALAKVSFERLYIAMSTLKTHINHIYSKLSVRSRPQAILQARSLHLF
jgi:ATP/maltotriose-dependent transcriptional regulator MalT